MKLVLFMVMSMDGIVAFDERTDIREYSSKEDRRFFLKEASACDAAVMGRFSFNMDVGCKKKYLLAHTPLADEEYPDTVILSGTAEEIYRKIKDDGNEKAALIGGPRTNAAFIKEGYVDEIYLTIEPVILGKGVHFAQTELKSGWNLVRALRLNERGTIVLHYVKVKGNISAAKRPQRWNGILHHARFLDIMKKLEEKEKDRKFCRHDLTHLLDTARIMHIINLEEDMCISKDLIYAAALLHDIGRLAQYKDGTPHEIAAVPSACDILKACGYSEEEREVITFAISAHRGGTPRSEGIKHQLAEVLFRADKAGRMCFACGAREECNWPEERKNAERSY